MTKKVLKKVIVKAPKVRPFDLSFKKTVENTRIIMAIESLKTNAGWQFLTQIFEENIRHLAKQIISKVGEGGEKLSDDEVDVLRFKHSYLEELLSKPDVFLKQLKREEVEDENLDPYE